MTEWLLARSPWSFVWLAYAVFLLALIIDAFPGLAAEARLRRELAAQQRRRGATDRREGVES